MGIEALTLALDGTTVVPTSDDDWDDWVSATALRGYLSGDTLTDWLARYGEANGFVRDERHDGYDERLEFPPFIMGKGGEFEQAIADYLGQQAPLLSIGEGREATRSLENAERTFEALSASQEIVHQGILRDPETRTYGAADFLIRSDVFDSLFPGVLTTAEVDASAPDLAGSSWHYVVVDAKFTTLDLLVSGEVGNGGSFVAYKAQLYVYNRALGRLQGYTPITAFLLGRGWRQTVNGVHMRGSNATERLGPVPMSDDIRVSVEAAGDWVRRLRTEGHAWEPLPVPSVPELWPTAGGFPWEKETSRITAELSDLTMLWQVGPDKRDAAHRADIYSWQDEKASAAALGVTGPATGPTLQAILDVNHAEGGPAVMPARVHAAEDEWRPTPPVEFYVDFETVNNVNDDFARIPEQNGQNLVYMIGCGHVENGSWQFSSFCVERLTEHAEAVMIDAWLEHMGETGGRLGAREEPLLIHWSYAEPVNYEEAYDSARERHPDKGWPKVRWFDLWNRVVRREPVVVRGALNFGLKTFARAMHDRGLIETSWGDSKVDGLGAMTGAWWCNSEVVAKGGKLTDVELMQDIAAYNEVDCKVMMEIVHYLRANH